MNHQDLTGRGAIHPFAFVQSTDPSIDPTNSVAANKAWIDTSNSPYQLKIRDATNTIWNVVLGLTTSARAFEPFTGINGPFMTATVTNFPLPQAVPEPFTLLTHI